MVVDFSRIENIHNINYLQHRDESGNSCGSHARLRRHLERA